MEAVDVLGQHPAFRLVLLQLGDGFVAGVGSGRQASLAKFREVLPAQRRIAPQHRSGKCRLDRQALFRATVVETA